MSKVKPKLEIKSNIFFIIKNIKTKILLFLLLFYAITSIILQFNNTFLIIKPLIILIILLYILLYQRNNLSNKIKDKDILIFLGISLIYILLIYLLGFKLGFLKNPLKLNYLNMIDLFLIIGIELARYIIINTNKNKFIEVLVTVLIIVSEINFYYIISLSSFKLLFMNLCSNIIPIIISNILYTYMARNKDYIIIIVLVIINKLTMLLPIFPNINWLTQSTLKILGLFLIYLLFKKRMTKELFKNNSFVLISYALTFIFATIIVCFMLGVFKYKPITILSNSMSPTLVRGDMIVYKKLNNWELDNLPLKTIIVFYDNNKYIVHRIVAKRIDDKITYYTTKGDNNLSNDSKEITSEDIEGVYVFHFNYLGYPSIWLYEYFNE